MTTLLAWAAKRAVIARITAWADTSFAQPTDPLYGVQVAYTLIPDLERVCVYGGQVRSVRAQASGEHAVLFREDVTVEVRIRVYEAGGDVQETEQVAEGIAQRIAAAVSAEPRISTGSVAVVSMESDPPALIGDPESGVTVNVLLVVLLSMNTPGA
jgi:hypothetical protein